MVVDDGATLRWRVAPYIVAAGLVLPLFAVEVWTGFRVAGSDDVLAVIAPSERPLSVRTPGGEWAILLALVWFGLAYWRRTATIWEAGLVLLGGVAALLRTGNAWLDGVALVIPLGRQLALLRPGRVVLGAAIVVGLTLTLVNLLATRPPALPPEAIEAVRASQPTRGVLADWRWAPELQGGLGQSARVLASGGLASETPDFWLNYVRAVHDHERWPAELDELEVDVLVLDTDQPGLVDDVRASPQWRVVYDAGHVLVARRAG